MKKLLIGLVIVVLVGGGLYFAFGNSRSAKTSAATSTESAPVLPPVKASNVIVADAKVVPAKKAVLSFPGAGVVAQVPVAEGDRIDKGQILVSLHSDKQKASVAQARAELQRAQARLDELKAGSRPQELEALVAALDIAKSRLQKVRVSGPPVEVTIAEAEVRKTQAQLDLAKSGTRPEAIAAAQADVAAAAAMLAQAEASLVETDLRAPFSGVVASIDINPGEYITPGKAAVWLADFATWHIETEDLTELSVIHVEEGDIAQIKLDAIPDLELKGAITSIKPLGVNRVGDITYTAIIVPDKQDPRFRWNMTASVTIDKSEK